jgi:hypothetical protein
MYLITATTEGRGLAEVRAGGRISDNIDRVDRCGHVVEEAGYALPKPISPLGQLCVRRDGLLEVVIFLTGNEAEIS